MYENLWNNMMTACVHNLSLAENNWLSVQWIMWGIFYANCLFVQRDRRNYPKDQRQFERSQIK